MRASWLESREQSPAQAAALLPLALAAGCVAAGARLHRALYRAGVLSATRLPCRVISVGNLGVGGSGKTPTAAWLAASLQRRGHKVVLASRGYGRQGREPIVTVSDGRFIHASVEQAGDEPFVLAAHAPGVPVLVGRDRALVGLRALSAYGAEILVLDDGFQHHRLARDLDVVVCDGGAGFRKSLAAAAGSAARAALGAALRDGGGGRRWPASRDGRGGDRAPRAARAALSGAAASARSASAGRGTARAAGAPGRRPRGSAGGAGAARFAAPHARRPGRERDRRAPAFATTTATDAATSRASRARRSSGSRRRRTR